MSGAAVAVNEARRRQARSRSPSHHKRFQELRHLNDPCNEDKKGNSLYGSQKFKTCKAVSKIPLIAKNDRKSFSIYHNNIKDSGCSGRIYQHLLKGSLGLAILEMTFYIFAVNIIFGLIYWFSGGCCGDLDPNFWDDFNFAFQTFTTVGYGQLAPDGVASNIIVFFQGIHNLVATTIFAGIVFTKFVQPRWKYKFSEYMVVANKRGVPTLQVRFANIDGSYNQLYEAQAKIYMGRNELDPDGQRFHPLYCLDLVSDVSPSMVGVWTLQHRIMPDSPLYAKTFEDMVSSGTHLHVTISGVDHTTGETVNLIEDYFPEYVLYGYQFDDQISFDKTTMVVSIDHKKFDCVHPAHVFYPLKNDGNMSRPVSDLLDTDEVKNPLTKRSFKESTPLVEETVSDKYGSLSSVGDGL
mmetsp:Transcript_22025/g.32828  ORF Transcript_22025/g.32828 Transcript_22025/m.32828 type:complete len:409 (-) Transcript_22025:51-1277(-)